MKWSVRMKIQKIHKMSRFKYFQNHYKEQPQKIFGKKTCRETSAKFPRIARLGIVTVGSIFSKTACFNFTPSPDMPPNGCCPGKFPEFLKQLHFRKAPGSCSKPYSSLS